MTYQCNLRADKLNDELAQRLHDINVWLVHIGLESANDRVLKGIGKNAIQADNIRTLEVLKKHCSEVGRDYDEIVKSNLMTVIIAEDKQDLTDALVGIREPGVSDEELDEMLLYGNPDEVAAKIERLIQAGLQYLIVNFKGAAEKDSLKLFVEQVIPQFL
jgi:alkanesulfonate monooxygenase SsuD/methylene tetrahydromethanopterin reductase-like flavin-dependent oxidoreductase (luciferase family)